MKSFFYILITFRYFFLHIRLIVIVCVGGHIGRHTVGHTGGNIGGNIGDKGDTGETGGKGDTCDTGEKGDTGTQGRTLPSNDILEFDYQVHTTSGIIYNNGLITLVYMGTYKISYFVNIPQPNQFSLFLNNIHLPESTFNTNYGMCIIQTLADNSILTMVNTTAGTNTIQPITNTGTFSGINSYALIEKIG